MKKFSILAIVLVLLMTTSIVMIAPVSSHARANADIYWYGSDTAAWAALVADDIDFIQWSMTSLQLEEAQNNPDLQVASYVENGMMEYDLNNAPTILDYPTSRNPCNDENVRKALACAVDKEYIIDSILEGLGSRIDSPLCYPQTDDWGNESVITFDWNHNGVIEPGEDNYPYNYNLDDAAAYLAASGFNDTDGNGYLNYPDGVEWGDAAGIDTTLMPLKICIRSDHGHRLEAGRYLVAQLEGTAGSAGDGPLALANWPAGFVGGDFDTTDALWEAPRATLSPIVMRDHNYHVYTGGWSFGRYPTYIFSLFNSMFWYQYGPNYIFPYNEHPDMDTFSADIWYAADLDEAAAACKLALGYHADHCLNIPLWSYTSYVAWRKELAGVVNMKGYGIENVYTFINAYRTDKPAQTAIRMGCVSGPDRLNILYSQWYFEYAMLDRIYTALLVAGPYELTDDIPWIAKDWMEEYYVDYQADPPTEKTKVTYYLRHDAGWATPVTGDLAGFFNADDLEFTIWYNYAFDDSWQWGAFMDIKYTKIVDDSTFEVYFDDISMWFKYSPTYPLIGPKDILIGQLCDQVMVQFQAPPIDGVFQFETDIRLGVVQIINAEYDSTPIQEGEDFLIEAGYDYFVHGVFKNLNVPPGSLVTLWYWRAKPDVAPQQTSANGIYLGGNVGCDWTDIMYALGSHYPVAIEAGVGGYATLNKNQWFFCSAVLLGETDWMYYWYEDAGYTIPAEVNLHDTSQSHPMHGLFKVDITDVVKGTAAYCHRGDEIYDMDYFPGGDLDAYDLCHVGILDLVTITGKYAWRFCFQYYPDYFYDVETVTGHVEVEFGPFTWKPEDPTGHVWDTHDENVENVEITITGGAGAWYVTIEFDIDETAYPGFKCGSIRSGADVRAFKIRAVVP